MIPLPRRRRGSRPRRAYTLVEILLVFLLSSMCLVILYELFFSGALRFTSVNRRAEGEMAVRILMARIRQELRHAVRPVEISNIEVTQLAIPLLDPTGSDDDPQNPKRYFSVYRFDREKREIRYQRVGGLTVEDGEVLEDRVWMGGDTPIHSLVVEHTNDNERILFLYYRVIVRVSFFDVKIKKRLQNVDDNGEPENLIHVSTTVYPRRINQELRIEVPQEGSLL